MATNVFKNLAQTQLSTTSVTTIYTVPALTATLVDFVWVLNTSTTLSCTVTMYRNGTASSNQITPPIPLGPGESFKMSSFKMATNQTISATASVANIINVNMDGDEVVAANI